MTKEKKRKQIGDWFTEHLYRLKLSGYSLYVLFSGEENYEDCAEDEFANVRVNYPYKSIYLSIKQTDFENRIKNYKECLLHEAVHVMLWDYTYLAEDRFVGKKQLLDAEERLVDHITNVLLSDI
jgi:hypothetical protein